MWGYAEGNERILAIVVVLVVAAALAYVGRRLFRGKK
jgi:hypothetical protein